MALALIGNLASKLLPYAISWGMGKLRSSNIGRGVAGNANLLLNKAAALTNTPTFKQISNVVSN